MVLEHGSIYSKEICISLFIRFVSGDLDFEMNDPRDEGCLCQGCNRRYRVDVMVADDLWKHICYPDWPNLLCGICIMERIEQMREFDCYSLIHGALISASA